LVIVGAECELAGDFRFVHKACSPRDADVRFLLRSGPPPRAWLVT
jgi:hypothetical protein